MTDQDIMNQLNRIIDEVTSNKAYIFKMLGQTISSCIGFSKLANLLQSIIKNQPEIRIEKWDKKDECKAIRTNIDNYKDDVDIVIKHPYTYPFSEVKNLNAIVHEMCHAIRMVNNCDGMRRKCKNPDWKEEYIAELSSAKIMDDFNMFYLSIDFHREYIKDINDLRKQDLQSVIDATEETVELFYKSQKQAQGQPKVNWSH